MFDINSVKTPCYVISEQALSKNLDILDSVMKHTGCKILLAQKAFSNFVTYPQLSKVLCGTTASGLYEAKLGREAFEGEVHVYSPAYTDDDMQQLVKIADHIVFNSFSQWKKHRDTVKNCGRSTSP